MTDAELLALAAELGFGRAAVLATEEIPLEPAFRKYCADNVCGKYGANYACPPDCGATEEMARRLRAYRRALALQTCWPFDGRDGGERDPVRQNAAQPADPGACRTLRRRPDGGGQRLRSVQPLPAGGRGSPAAFPDWRFSCMSAYCVHVAKLAERCGMDYYAEGSVHLFSLCCFDRREES